MRLAGQGHAGGQGAPAGDLLLRVKVQPDPRFTMNGKDLTTVLPIAPWEAALGGEATVPTLEMDMTLTIPAGSSSGQRLRLRGKGFPGRSGSAAGDLYVELKVVVPKILTPEERAAWEELRRISNFQPRGT